MVLGAIAEYGESSTCGGARWRNSTPGCAGLRDGEPKGSCSRRGPVGCAVRMVVVDGNKPSLTVCCAVGVVKQAKVHV